MTRILPVCAALVALLTAAAVPVHAAPLPQAPDCPIFPADNPWNQRVDSLPVAAGSASLVRNAALTRLHADFSDADADGYGIPFNVVDGSTPRSAVDFWYADESDAGPYPIPEQPAQEGGSDRHILLLERDECRLYELFAAERDGAGQWSAGSGAIFDLTSNALRPAGWTSADAAGLPIFPGLARYDEVVAGRIDHALRMTLPVTQRAYLWPARHYASSNTAPWESPMGMRLRVKASYDISRHPPQARVVLRAAQQYGLIVADNGSAGFVTGAPDPGWDDHDLHSLHQVPASAFEVVDTSSLPGSQPARRAWNVRIDRPSSTRVRARFYHSRRGACSFEAVRGGRVVRRTRTTCRQGMPTLSMRPVSRARYRIVLR